MPTLRTGQKVKVSAGSGLASNKTATVVDRREIKTDGRGIPTNIEGAYKPVDWSKEVAIKYENGEYDTMFKNRLSIVQEENVDEARKVTDKIVQAFLSGQKAKLSNTHTDGTSYYLFNNKIAKMENGKLWITNCGYNTRTTYERLNALPGVSISVKQGTPYLNGVEWDGEWTKIEKAGQNTPQLSTVEARVKRVLKQMIREEIIKRFSKKKI